jgi:hypothetical protein
MTKIRVIIQYFKAKINIILINFTLAKFIAALFTIILAALVKYYVSGGLKVDNLDIVNNIAIGLLSWTVNTGIIDWLTDYLGIKGINFNLKQFIFGFNTLNVDTGSFEVNDKNKIVIKLYNAMESHEGSNSGKPLDKGKGINWDQSEAEANTKPLDKGKGIARREAEIKRINKWKSINWNEIRTKFLDEDETKSLRKGKEIEDPQSVFFPKGTNPGPGFNVSGKEVPIRDDICQHIDYNSHILNQFKKMDLETAIEQRNNYFASLKVLNGKLAYAQDALIKVPTIPTTEYEFKLRNRILSDIDIMNRDKIRLEAKATLINSRIEFIESKINKN